MWCLRTRPQAHRSTLKTASHAQEPAAAEKPAPAEKPAGKAGGVYIPPFKLAQMLREARDETSAQYQRLRWDALRKSVNGLINKVNKDNIKAVLPEIFGEVGGACCLPTHSIQIGTRHCPHCSPGTRAHLC